MRQLTFIWMLILAVFSLPANAQFKKPVGKQALPATGSHFQPAPLPPLRPSVPAGSSFGTSFRGNHSLGALPKPVAGAPALFAYVDAATGTPYAVSGKFIATKNTDREKVAEYLEAAAPVLKLNDPAQEFQISRIQEEANGYRHYFLKQVWKGVEVYGAEAVLHEKDGEFYLFNGRYFPSPLLPSVTPAISAAEALELVKADLRNTEPVKELTEWEQKLANYEGPLTKQVIWIELTSPWEENMDKWNLTKRANYNHLKVECEQKGWKVFPLCVEVGCRGHVSDKSFPYMCGVLGFSKRERKDLKWALERTALYCSYAIFVYRFHLEWGKKPLLHVSVWH